MPAVGVTPAATSFAGTVSSPFLDLRYEEGDRYCGGLLDIGRGVTPAAGGTMRVPVSRPSPSIQLPQAPLAVNIPLMPVFEPLRSVEQIIRPPLAPAAVNSPLPSLLEPARYVAAVGVSPTAASFAGVVSPPPPDLQGEGERYRGGWPTVGRGVAPATHGGLPATSRSPSSIRPPLAPFAVDSPLPPGLGSARGAATVGVTPRDTSPAEMVASAPPDLRSGRGKNCCSGLPAFEGGVTPAVGAGVRAALSRPPPSIRPSLDVVAVNNPLTPSFEPARGVAAVGATPTSTSTADVVSFAPPDRRGEEEKYCGAFLPAGNIAGSQGRHSLSPLPWSAQRHQSRAQKTTAV